MADEIVNTEQTLQSVPEAPQVEEPQDVIPKAEFEALKAKNTQLEQQLEALRSTLMSPEYLNLLRGMQAPQAPPAPAPEPEPEPDFGSMDPKQLAEYVVRVVKRELEPKVADAVTKAELVKAQQEVQECAAKYPDFWMYRTAMYEIAQEFGKRGQSISAEEAYFLAKGRTLTSVDRERQKKTTKPATAQAKPPVAEKPSAGIAPGTTATGGVKSVREAFERAWKESGLGG